jgi:hypothetical protein
MATELDQIYERMLKFVGEMGEKYPKIEPLTTKLSQAKSLNLFMRVFSSQAEIKDLIQSFDNTNEEETKKEANKLIDALLLKNDLDRHMFVEESSADFDKLARYLILWAHIAHKEM